MREYPLSDAVFYWLSDHPRATGFILAALILFVSSVGDARYGG